MSVYVAAAILMVGLVVQIVVVACLLARSITNARNERKRERASTGRRSDA